MVLEVFLVCERGHLHLFCSGGLITIMHHAYYRFFTSEPADFESTLRAY